MLVDSSPTDSSSTNSNYSISSCANDIPSTIIWKQTKKSITLQININHVCITLTERYLKLSNRSKTITLPLYGNIYLEQCHVQQMVDINKPYEHSSSLFQSNAIELTLEKECFDLWPHLLMQQTDQEVEFYLLEANFLVHIYYQQNEPASPSLLEPDTYDILDFETVINGQGEKTGLE
ncbi:uncharacterized protein ATC70_008380 [Mucor velutinosus]|uniref:CS domain-containing protein n=1 Tax=Mucor velutinosus TaxID=708070 RepID=A0AAN7DMU3_9FUNG|nr:hypothetical protein ATC70_008380 [Mucor velutinosus]